MQVITSLESLIEVCTYMYINALNRTLGSVQLGSTCTINIYMYKNELCQKLSKC